nr:esterase/lipase [uncultured Gammaproteobacteria bacterium]
MPTIDRAPALPYTAYEIDTAAYDRAVRLFRFAKRFLHLNFKLHAPEGLLNQAQIFVFNHFARFETLIPQYLLYECCRTYCCAIAHRELFEVNENLGRWLLSVGAIPHDHPQLLPLLARQILRGRKVIVFPEGGMVKDRRVVDRKGRYRIYSRTALDRRRQHTGAAVLALVLDLFKQAVLTAYAGGQEDRLARWQQQLNLQDRDEFLARCREPTLIAAANITFFPLRIDDNFIHKAIETIRPGISKRLLEELLIEGNLLLKDTDMDIHLDEPIRIDECWRPWERWLYRRLLPQIDNLEEIFVWHTSQGFGQRFLARRLRRNAHRIRDQYMAAMYRAVTVHLCHLAATLIYEALRRGRDRLVKQTFNAALYLAIKRIQREPGLFLHRSLGNPDNYRDLPAAEPPSLKQFFCTAESAGLIEPVGGCYHFLPKLSEEFELDRIRLENPVLVYANEVAPLSRVQQIVGQALDQAERLTARELAGLRFDDEIRSWHWDKKFYSAPCFAEINQLETLTKSAEPFLFSPKACAKGVLLVHGLLASPAAMRPLGETLVRAGYTVLGVRLKGHGTSPCDLRERTFSDWYASVRRGFEILADLTPTVAVVGFSTGGLLALLLAADQPDPLTAVAAIASPIKFRSPTLALVPLVHQAQRLTEWMPNGGFKGFLLNQSEHPKLNYRHVPIQALHELRGLIAETKARLPEVQCPVLLLQGDGDPVVDPDSAQILFDQLGTHRKILALIGARRHNIVYEDPGGVHAMIRFFLDQHGLCR